MIRSYTYTNGKAILSDEKGNQEVIDYYDNLDKVLVKKNLIEKMEYLSSQFAQATDNLIKKDYGPAFLTAYTVSGLALPSAIVYGATGKNPFTYNFESIWGPVNMTAILTGCTIVPCVAMGIHTYNQIHDQVRQYNGLRAAICYLDDRTTEEYRKIDELEADKSCNSKLEENSIHPVDNTELIELNDTVLFYNGLGKDIKKYYRAYEKGKLEKKLETKYDEEATEKAVEFIKAKGPMLVKKIK